MVRIISFILICSFASACQVAQHADNALYSLANSVSSEDLITGQRKLSSADRKKQISQGNRIIESIIQKYQKDGKKINEELDRGQYDRLLGIFKKVHSVSHLRHEQWDIYLIPEDSFNAFVTGGTAVVVHMGLMKDLKFDDEIAAVIAHEIAHVAANHVFERQGAMMASMLGRSKSMQHGAVQAAYTHNDESEADKVGILYAALAGYDPKSSSRIWNSLYKKSGNSGQRYQDHPMNSERAKMAGQFADKVKDYYIPGRVNPNFANILVNNNLWQKKGSSHKAGSGGGVAAVAETLVSYYKDKQNAKKEAYRQSKRIAMLKNMQSDMDIIGGNKLDDGRVEMLIHYVGKRPIGKLAIKAKSTSGSSLYRHNAVVRPDEKFSAIFSGKILKSKNGSAPEIKLIVDEGQYF